jgi:hypothetical protein
MEETKREQYALEVAKDGAPSPMSAAPAPLTFNDDGTIDPEQLVGLHPDLVEKITSPDFIARAKEGIAADKARQSFIRGAQQIKAAALAEHQARRPSGVSGRQRKRLRRLARKAQSASAVH